MLTPEEIVKVLRCCAKSDTHCVLECPYKSDSTDTNCMQIFEDAAAIIEQLESENMAMKIQRRGDCGVCKHSGVQIGAEPCASCVVDKDRPAWEDKGLPEVENR